MTAIAGNNFLITMPCIEQYDINNFGNGYNHIAEYAQAQLVKTEFYQNQKQHLHSQPPQQQHQQHQQQYTTYLPMSGSTSPHSPQQPNLLFSPLLCLMRKINGCK